MTATRERRPRRPRGAGRRRARVTLVYLFGSAADLEANEVEDPGLGDFSEPPLDADALLRLGAAVTEAVRAPVDLIALEPR
ncbi:MAG: hypothetical protein U0802_13120 [Candidatus Binatia bacterium]